MNILSLQGLNKAYGVRPLLTDVNIGVEERDRIGIIGANGSGKSTLMKIMAAAETADSGKVTRRSELRVAYVSQKPVFEPGRSVLECVLAGEDELHSAVREYERASLALERGGNDERHLRALESASSRLDACGGWDTESRARQVLARLGLNDPGRPAHELSGGFRRRIGLAAGLMAEADLLLLDEPTNHLDTDMIDWLETWLGGFPGAVAMVTHDRYFLDRVTRMIWELDRGRLWSWPGNFSYYLEKKAEREAAQEAHDRRDRVLLDKELKWLARGARARRTHEKARIRHAEDLAAKAPEAPRRKSVAFNTVERRLGRQVVELENVSKSFGPISCAKNFSFVFNAGDRIGIVGPNGSGKTTLVRLMTGELPPDSGSVRIGETVVFGHYDQESRGLDPGERALEYIQREAADNVQTADGGAISATVMLERFLFNRDAIHAPIGKLSGGEQRRLYLVRVLMRNPNFLILDEPTNDLDIPTLQALEDYLDGFRGCLVIISHDRYFLDRNADRLLSPEPDGRWRTWPGSWTVYQSMKSDEAGEAAAEGSRSKSASAGPGAKTPASEKPPAAAGGGIRRKLSYKEQRELESLEEGIPEIETELRKLQEQMAAAASDYERLKSLSEKQGELDERLRLSMERWGELASLAEGS